MTRSRQTEPCAERAWLDVLPAILLGFAGLVATTAMTLARPSSEGTVAVVFPPWADRHANLAAVATDDAVIVSEAMAGTVLIVRPDSPAFREHLQTTHAVAVIGSGSAGGCAAP
jgi:hypothetical protein